MSDKRHRFEKVATKRIDKILHTLDLLGNCSNTYNYEYTEQDVAKIFKTLNTKLNEIKGLYNHKLNNQKFKL